MRDVSFEWINHAGYVLRHGETSIATDPWLNGSVFDRGWDLISPTVFNGKDWDGVTHLWLSHEHPDHFHPPSLLSIPETARADIEVLFQDTPDHRVATWCTSRFGEVRELAPTDWVELDDDLRVRCVPHDNGDSWLAMDTPAGLVLNLNDCVIRSRSECEAILELVGQPDVLLSQFSYANWVGNPGDTKALTAAADEQIDWLRTQIEVLRPRVTIPFASFMWFSHEDNAHLNEGKLSIAEMVERLDDCDTDLQILYPGDRWTMGEIDQSLTDAAIDRYDRDMVDCLAGDRRPGTTTEWGDLAAASRDWGRTLRKKNGRMTALLPPARVWVVDHDRGYLLDHRGLREAELEADRCDLSVRSDALAAVFAEEFGGRTLDINGRFTIPPKGQYRRFKALATLAAFNARDESWAEIFQTIGRRGSHQLKRQLAKRVPFDGNRLLSRS